MMLSLGFKRRRAEFQKTLLASAGFSGMIRRLVTHHLSRAPCKGRGDKMHIVGHGVDHERKFRHLRADVNRSKFAFGCGSLYSGRTDDSDVCP
jgi:hypothetical protein